MAYGHVIRRRVEFAETDMAGIVHFSTYFRYMEAAEAAFFRELGLPLIEADSGGARGWPRVRAQCDFSGPLHFDDIVEVQLLVEAIKIKAIAFRFRLFRIGDDGWRHPIARGGFTTVYATRTAADPAMQAETIPQALLDRIEEAPESVLKDRTGTWADTGV
ncbi:MAG: acyl-CoA thioesterase [Opitutales bacterium]